MITFIFIHLILLLFLLFCSGFFSSAEVAFFSLNNLEIRRFSLEEPEKGPKVARALTQPTSLLSSILIGNTLVNVCTSVVGYSFVRGLAIPYAKEFSIPIITLLLLIFGEIGPKRVAIHKNIWLAGMYAPVLLFLIKSTAPIRWLLQQITRSLESYFPPENSPLSDKEYETLIDISQEAGVLDEDEGDMVKGIIKLEDLKISDIMTPRMDIIGIDLSDSWEDNDRIIRNHRLSRMLIYRDHLDHVEGILDVRAYLLDPEHRLADAWRAPHFVPESVRLDRMLEDFQSRENRIVVVVDEYGGTAGIITRGDILEEIAGDMTSEFNAHKLNIEKISDNHWLLDGQISLEDLNEELDLALDAESVDRLAGWITAQTVHLPHAGEVIEHQGCRAIVRQMRKHRITLVELIRLEASS